MVNAVNPLAVREAYETLGVPVGAPAREIRHAFNELARHRHPDVDPSPDAVAEFRRIRSAYETLRDAHGLEGWARQRAVHAYLEATLGPPPRLLDVVG
jgi:DnaJ domain